jgi:2-polyprenyl-6-methoxyphenol hydroxylase-like FAD-dependent oxidoreductase
VINTGERRTLRVLLPDGVPRSTAELIEMEQPEIETATGCRVVDAVDAADLTLQWTIDPGAAAASMRVVADGFRAVVRSMFEVTETSDCCTDWATTPMPFPRPIV